MNNMDNKNPEVYGVIGICGVVSNLIARMLIDHGYHVIGTDLHKKEECDYLYTLTNYKIPIYLSEHPESFFNESTCIVTPPSLMETSDFFKQIKRYKKDILSVEDMLNTFKPNKPVICITGTNGKTTTTTLLKHICRQCGFRTHRTWF